MFHLERKHLEAGLANLAVVHGVDAPLLRISFSPSCLGAPDEAATVVAVASGCHGLLQ
jgi:hypothetical protein